MMNGGDEQHQDFSVDVVALRRDIFRFETESQLPEDLDWHVSVCQKTQALWYKGLLKAWVESEPKDSEEAMKLVEDALQSVTGCLDVLDLMCFLNFYRHPDSYSIEEHTSSSEAPLSPEYDPAPAFVEGAPAFKFWTLPVTRDSVTDGVGFTVSVEVKDTYLLPPDIQFMVCERRKALAKRDYRRARELMNQINTTGDYQVVDIRNEEMLTRKYHIRLRGIRAPEIGMPNGTLARDELAKMVTGMDLKIFVHYLDDLMRCVGNVYHRGKLLQEILLKKRVASLCVKFITSLKLSLW